MSLKKEINNFQVAVTDAAGDPVLGYAGSINAEIVVGGVTQSTTITEITGSVISGYYNIEVDFTATGSGRYAFSVDDPVLYNIDPEFDTFTVEAFDNDDIYSLQLAAIQTAQETNLGGDYSRQTLTFKYGKDWNRNYTVLAEEAGTATLSGWTNFGFDFYTSDAYTQCPSSADEFLYREGVVTVVDADSMIVNTSGGPIAPTIPCGQNFTTLYADLVGTDPSGTNKTLKEVVIKVVRAFG